MVYTKKGFIKSPLLEEYKSREKGTYHANGVTRISAIPSSSRLRLDRDNGRSISPSPGRAAAPRPLAGGVRRILIKIHARNIGLEGQERHFTPFEKLAVGGRSSRPIFVLDVVRRGRFGRYQTHGGSVNR